jgi:ligand-binding sensor domain-containing protein
MKTNLIYRFTLFEKVSIFFCFLIIGSGYLPAQPQPLSFQRISLEQGLSQTIVESILQDERGFMWFSSEDGLNRYDGYTFTVMRNDPDDPYSLSHNHITYMYEDRSGIIWLGTNYGGLNRYDPNTGLFTHYRHDPDDIHSLSNDIVLSICEDHTGALWVGTSFGLNKLIPAEDLNRDSGQPGFFIRYTHHRDDPMSLGNNTITVIRNDARGNLLIGTAGGVNFIDRDDIGLTKNEHVFFHDIPGNILKKYPELGTARVNDIYTDPTGILWFGLDAGLYKVSPSTIENVDQPFSVTRYAHDPDNRQSLSHNQVNAIYEDLSGNFWIGTNGGGLNILDRESEIFSYYVHDPRDARSISYNEILSMYEDRSGNLWIGTYGGGVSKVDRGRKRFAHYTRDPENPNSLGEPIVWNIYEDSTGTIWLGTHGGGLNKFDRPLNRYNHLRADPGNPLKLQSDFIRCIIEDRNGYLWLGTNDSGITRFERDRNIFTTYTNDPNNRYSLSDNTIRSLFEDRSGTLWIGTVSGGLNKMIPGKSGTESPTFIRYRHDPADPNTISSDYIRIVFQDRSGNLWIGTYGGGLNKFDPEKEIFTRFRADKSNPESLNNDYVFTIHEDKNGILWLGTWGGGLSRFNPATGIFTGYTDKHGLPSNAIYGILQDDHGNLWLSTNNGISKFDPVRETFRNYKVSDGLQSTEFNGGSYYKSRNGEFFFGGVNGFNSFFPDEIEDNQYIPPIVITSFKKLNREVLFDKPVTDIRDIRLSHRDYVFSFEFAALDFTAPEENQYAYKMEGLDRDWNYTDSRKRFANYTTLPPGKYVFQVKASNNDGIWNEEGVAVAITITPPFWKSWWFIVLTSIALLIIGYTAYSRRLKTIGMKIELKTAHDTQMSIMPQQDPEIPGFDISGICVPANEVGGDFFDYLWWDEGQKRIGIVVGDVSGKAMKAAMIAVLTSGMIHAEASEQFSVHEILTRINRPLYAKTQKGIFIALCLAVIDTENKYLRFANAGLNKPVIKSQSTVSVLKGNGVCFPLGMVSDSTYHETIVSLKAGDVVVFYSDGISEARDHSKNLYGNERLYALLENTDTGSVSAQQIKELILNDIKKFTGYASRSDDMTVVVVKVC